METGIKFYIAVKEKVQLDTVLDGDLSFRNLAEMQVKKRTGLEKTHTKNAITRRRGN